MLLTGGVARAEVLDGVQLPDPVLQGGRATVPVSASWENALKLLNDLLDGDVFPPVDRRHGGDQGDSHRQPGWSRAGLNVYEANEEVRVYVVPPEGVPAKAPKKKSTPKK